MPLAAILLQKTSSFLFVQVKVITVLKRTLAFYLSKQISCHSGRYLKTTAKKVLGNSMKSAELLSLDMSDARNLKIKILNFAFLYFFPPGA